MDFRVLGPLEITDGPRVVHVNAPKQRCLLAALLLKRNQVVSLDALVDQLWGEDPPPQAAGAVQAYVSNLRRGLEPDRPPRAPASVLISRPPGYLLAVDPSRYDAACFETAVEAARRGLIADDPESARQGTDAALALWRGPALAEFVYQDFARAEAARLEELRVSAWELRAEADLALGRHAAIVGELERLVAEHPLRERLWALLMLALYRSGRQSDALRVYQQCRTTLGEELGLAPGPELRRLEVAILDHSADLEWQPPPEQPVAAPDPGAHAPSPVSTPRPFAHSGFAFVGRTEELARLQGAWSRAAAGAGGIVLVSGEAGIGKTRLVEELGERVSAGGSVVAWGGCPEGDGAPAFWPWTQVLRDLARRHAAGDVLGLAAAAGLPQVRLAPLLLDEGVDEPAGTVADPAEARFRLNQAAVELLVALAHQRELLVVLDDLQWADAGSSQLLQRLVDQLVAVPLLVVGTFRDVEVTAGHPLAATLAAIARGPVVDRIRLDGLSEAELVPLIADATGAGPSHRLVAVVHARTEGNPFFAGELVRLLESEHHLEDPSAAQHTEVPTGVLEVVRRRLMRLPEQTNAVLTVAAVIGDEFDVAVLEAVTGLDEEGALDALELALVSGLVREVAGKPGSFQFVHALVRQSIHDGLSQLRRARLHARIADALERVRVADDASATEVAGHVVAAAGAVDAERAVPALLRAADVAQRQLAYEQVEAHLRRVLELVPTLPAGGDRDTHERAARARLGVLLSWTHGHSAPEVTGAFVRASELEGSVPDAVEEMRLRYGLFLGRLFAPDLPAAVAQARDLLDAGERSGDPRQLLAGHAAMGMVCFHRGELALSADHTGRAATLAEPLEQLWMVSVLQADGRSSTRNYGALGLALAGQPDGARALVEEAVERARAGGHPFSIALALVMRPWVSVMLGHPEEAVAAAQEAVEFAGDRGFTALSGAAAAFHAWGRARTGDANDTVALVSQGRETVRSSGMLLLEHFLLALQADVEQEAGLLDAALASAERGLARAEATGDRFYEAELHRLRGELLHRAPQPRSGEAAAALRTAAEVARRQGAAHLEARAVSTQHRLGLA